MAKVIDQDLGSRREDSDSQQKKTSSMGAGELIPSNSLLFLDSSGPQLALIYKCQLFFSCSSCFHVQHQVVPALGLNVFMFVSLAACPPSSFIGLGFLGPDSTQLFQGSILLMDLFPSGKAQLKF